MNGKASRMLRQMRRGDHASKRHFNSLTHIQRGMVRTAHEDNVKLIYIDFLHKLFPVEGWEKKAPTANLEHYIIEKSDDMAVQHGIGLEEELVKAITENVEATRNEA